jgi:hypothetical protein
MPGRKVPFESRVILALAALLAPSWQRTEWRGHWRSKCEAWWIFNRDFPGARIGLLGEALSAVPDALWRRLDREEAPRRLHLALGSPLFIGILLLCMLGLVGMLSGGFRETRAMFQEQRPGNSRLVLLSNHSPFLGYASGVPSTRFLVWARYQKSLESYAAYSWGGAPGGRVLARVEPQFFDVLGLPHLLKADCFDCAVAADPRDTGRTVRLDGRDYRVTAAVPPGFRFGAIRPAYWIPLNLGTLPRRLGVIGLLRQGVSVERAEHDLGVGVMPLSRLVWESVAFYAVGFCLALAVALFRVVFDRAFWAHASGRLRKSWRFWAFCAVKSVFVVALVAVTGVEVRFGIAVTTTGARDPLLLALATWPLMLAFGGALLWSWLDQRLRCRRCLRRLDLPVHMGVLGASLFDPTGIESVCPVGHGALYEPDTGMSDAAWITLDEFFSTQDR